MTLPILERTSNETGRLIVYHIQQGDTNLNNFYLYKTVIMQGGIMDQDKSFLFGPIEYELLHNSVIEQGFIPIAPGPDDDPRIFMTYL